MAIEAINNINGGAALSNSRKSIAENFDTFLTLLTTQLKNQNPLDPLDTNQFTQQMVQFTGVEQQLKTNEYLKALSTSAQNGANTEAVTFIGKHISASGANAQLSDGSASWGYELPRTASNTTITITDAQGNTVFTETTPLAGGKGDYIWSGKDGEGQQLADGNYSITIDARDSNGAYVGATTQITGQVSGVDLSGSEPVLIVDGARVRLSTVTAVNASA